MFESILVRLVYDYDKYGSGGILTGLSEARDFAIAEDIGVVFEYRQKAAVRVYPGTTDEELAKMFQALLGVDKIPVPS